jgi:vacuolar iron transporter family protein
MIKELPSNIKKNILSMQQNEITEYYVYRDIAKNLKNLDNKAILEEIANQEKSHYEFWVSQTKVTAKPSQLKRFKFKLLNFLFGFTFTLKLMEKGEDRAQDKYNAIVEYFPEGIKIAQEESAHEKELLNMLDEDRLNYVGSMVLGLNDALVELSGTLAGLTLAFSATPELIPISGLITGIAASLSMASSEYLSAKADGRSDAIKSAIYTGIAYIFTVIILILPYLLLTNTYISLGIMLSSVVLVIFFFNYYISVAKNLAFKRRFFEMVFISLGVAFVSFVIGHLVNTLFFTG